MSLKQNKATIHIRNHADAFLYRKVDITSHTVNCASTLSTGTEGTVSSFVSVIGVSACETGSDARAGAMFYLW